MAHTETKRSTGFPRSRVLVTAMVAGAAFITLCLVIFALVVEFPAPTETTNPDKTNAPPEDVIRSQRELLNE